MAVMIALLAAAGRSDIGRATMPGSPVKPRAETPDPYGAADACMTFVQRQLPSPSTAQWPERMVEQGTVSSDATTPTLLTVHHWVDSENEAGATVRTEYDCSVQYKGEGRWGLVRLSTVP
jgi:hypothetical protein